MDPQDSDQEAEAAAMAQMMGFTAFGAQAPPSKKRRYNPRADAMADSGPVPPAPGGTGANTLPLLPRSAQSGGQVESAPEGSGGVAVRGGEGEVVLGQEGSGAAGDEGAGRGGGGDDDDPAPQYIDTSRSPVRTGGDETASAGAAAVFGSGRNQPAGRGGRGGGGAGPGKRIWWTEYYDPSSNENPWEGLEKARGLKPVGSWLSRGHAANRVGGGRSG